MYGMIFFISIWNIESHTTLKIFADIWKKNTVLNTHGGKYTALKNTHTHTHTHTLLVSKQCGCKSVQGQAGLITAMT